MQAVVVFETMRGNTHAIADAIGAGLKTAFDVTVVPSVIRKPTVLADVDLVMACGPAHAHGMSRAATGKVAAKAANTPASP